MSVTLKTNNEPLRALIDTGCKTNLMFKNCYERLCQKQKLWKVTTLQEGWPINGVGDQPIIVRTKVQITTNLYGALLGITECYIVDVNKDDYDVILGLNFMKEKKIKITPQKELITFRTKDKGQYEIFLDVTGKIVKRSVIKAYPVVTKEKIVIKTNEPTLINIGFNKKHFDQKELSIYDRNLFIEGKEAAKNVRQKLHVYEGITNNRNMQVCVQIKPECIEKTVTIKKGTVLGKLYSIEDEMESDENLCSVAAEIGSGNPKPQRWTKEKLFSTLKFGHLTPEQRKKAEDLCWKYKEVISTGEEEEFKTSKLPPFKIELTDELPIYIRPRHFPTPLANEIEQSCDKMNKQGIIEECRSAWNAAIVPVRKSDGSLRICIDYRKVNEKTIKNRFPMKLISDCVYNMKNMNWFTKLDLVKGYYQMEIEPESRKYTAFSTTSKHYQFKSLSFGLANAPAAFQSAMNVELADLPKKNIVNFMDDILAMNETFEKSLEITGRVLEKLGSLEVKVNALKCEWFVTDVEFLGHTIGRSGLRKSERFIEKVREFPRPKTVKDLKGFLGLVEFQRKFIKGCSVLTKPLNAWTSKHKKTQIVWTEEMMQAFDNLRQRAAQDVELAYPDYCPDSLPLEVWTDASNYGIGGMLTQIQEKNGQQARRVIGYVSKALNKAEKRYSTIERELAGLRFGIKAFRPFLYGIPFILKTDHQPLVYLYRMKIVDNRLARTYEDLADFDYGIEYIPGERNQMADLMSRIPANFIEAKIPQGEAEKQLPPGVVVEMIAEGGSLSMFQCLHVALSAIQKENSGTRNPKGPSRILPQTPEDLRKEILTEAARNPEALGLPKSKDYTKMLLAMINNGTPYQEVLLTASDLYEVIVHVHFGDKQPIIYRHHRVHHQNKRVVHLQCLGGTHYNLVKETEGYHHQIKQDAKITENIEFKEENLVGIHSLFTGRLEEESRFCQHSRAGGFSFFLEQNSGSHCCLVDTGSQIGLVKRSILTKLDVKAGKKVDVMLKGITNAKCLAMEMVNVKFKILDYEKEYEMELVVLEDNTFPYCFLLGIDFIRKYGITVDVDMGKLLILERVIGEVSTNSTTVVRDTGFSGTIEMELLDNQEIIEDEEIQEWQEQSCEIKDLIEVVAKNRDVKNWPGKLHHFKRHAKNLVMVTSTLYYLMKGGESGEPILVPVLPLPIVVGLSLMMHRDMYVHIGKHKLWAAMKTTAFYPTLRKICEEVATTCETCQLYKKQNAPSRPPLRKIDVKDPFEMIVTDCVNLPVTKSGSIGAVILEDHKSKMLWAVALRNKTSKHVADQIEKFILPTLPMKPNSCLSDNGPEYSGSQFEQMLKRNGIRPIKIIPYMSSSNGLAERTIQTISELLRLSQENGKDWDENLAKVIWSYNATKHSSHGLAPRTFLFNTKIEKGKAKMNEEQQQFWRTANEKYRTFEIGEKIIVQRQVIGRRVENKLSPKFDGPYEIDSKHDNGVTYVVRRQVEGKTETKRVHQKQIRKWREPPRYIKEHPVYQMAKTDDETRMKLQIEQENSNDMYSKQIVVTVPLTPIKDICSKATQTLTVLEVDSPTESNIGLPLQECTPITKHPEDYSNGMFIDDEVEDVSAEIPELEESYNFVEVQNKEEFYKLCADLNLDQADESEDEEFLGFHQTRETIDKAEKIRAYLHPLPDSEEPRNATTDRISKSTITSRSSSRSVKDLTKLFEEVAKDPVVKSTYPLRSRMKKLKLEGTT